MAASPRPVADPEHSGAFLPDGARRKAGLNRSIYDTAPGEHRRQLNYEMGWHGRHLVVADRFFPSSKQCSRCQAVKAKPHFESAPTAASNGLALDRDHDAARNLAACGKEHQVAGSGPETRNGRGRDTIRTSGTDPGSRTKRQDGSGQPAKAVTASSQGEAA